MLSTACSSQESMMVEVADSRFRLERTWSYGDWCHTGTGRVWPMRHDRAGRLPSCRLSSHRSRGDGVRAKRHDHKRLARKLVAPGEYPQRPAQVHRRGDRSIRRSGLQFCLPFTNVRFANFRFIG